MIADYTIDILIHEAPFLDFAYYFTYSFRVIASNKKAVYSLEAIMAAIIFLMVILNCTIMTLCLK